MNTVLLNQAVSIKRYPVSRDMSDLFKTIFDILTLPVQQFVT